MKVNFVFEANNKHYALSFTKELIEYLEKNPESQQELLRNLLSTAKKALEK